MRVAIHRNLTTGQWVVSSVKTTRNGERKDKKLYDLEAVTIENASFVISSEKTQQRIARNIADKSVSAGREVVAYAIGDLFDKDADPANVTCGIHYNPSRSHHFTDQDGDVISHQTYFRMYFLDGRDSEGEEAYAL